MTKKVGLCGPVLAYMTYIAPYCCGVFYSFLDDLTSRHFLLFLQSNWDWQNLDGTSSFEELNVIRKKKKSEYYLIWLSFDILFYVVITLVLEGDINEYLMGKMKVKWSVSGWCSDNLTLHNFCYDHRP